VHRSPGLHPRCEPRQVTAQTRHRVAGIIPDAPSLPVLHLIVLRTSVGSFGSVGSVNSYGQVGAVNGIPIPEQLLRAFGLLG
jgi:hypothetical protein